ncbi:hypothetical protein RCL1_004819 [Eukaryota sp. TZLM3-RCL]
MDFNFASLSASQKSALDGSSTLTELVSSQCLKSLLTDIITSPNPLSCLDNCLQNVPEFEQFYFLIVDLIGHEAQGHLELASKQQETVTNDYECSSYEEDSLVQY